MKELTKKVLESGLIDRATAALLEKWGALDPDETDLVGRERITKQTLHDFVEDLELLLQPEAIERKEVQLDPLLNMCTTENPCGQRWCPVCQ